MRVTGGQRAAAEATQDAFLRRWRTGVAGGAELLERGVDLDGVPQDDAVEHQAERAEPVRNRSIDQPFRGSTEQMTDDALAMPGQLEIQRHADSHGVVLALRGELDLLSAPEFEQKRREIEATRPGRILIDLRNLDFMDCTGISLMIGAQQSAHANGHLLALRRGPNQVQRLFQLLGLLDHFTFLDERPPRRDAPAVSSGRPEPVECNATCHGTSNGPNATPRGPQPFRLSS
jgi:anti-sigma B factor antagonist